MKLCLSLEGGAEEVRREIEDCWGPLDHDDPKAEVRLDRSVDSAFVILIAFLEPDRVMNRDPAPGVRFVIEGAEHLQLRVSPGGCHEYSSVSTFAIAFFLRGNRLDERLSYVASVGKGSPNLFGARSSDDKSEGSIGSVDVVSADVEGLFTRANTQGLHEHAHGECL